MALQRTTCAALYETPDAADATGDGDAGRAQAPAIIDRGRAPTGRTLLTEVESKQLLAAYGIPTVATRVAPRRRGGGRGGRRDRLSRSSLKLHSETITHKTDVGGVQLNLADAEAVARAPSTRSRRRSREHAGAGHFQGVTVQPMVDAATGYELILGSSLDPQFGPVLLFGTGGQLVEVFRDRALALPPLNTTLARRMMEQTRIYAALQGVRGRPPVDLGGAGAAAGPLQPAGRRAALDQGDRHQPAARLARAAASRSTPASSCTARTSPTTSCRGRRSAPTRRSTSRRGR